MKKYIYSLAFTATALISTACSDDVVNDIPQIPDSQKEMIAFTTSAETGSASSSSATRAGFTGGREYSDQSSGTYATQIIARFSSEKSSSEIRHTKTILNAAYDEDANKGANMASYSDVTYASGQERFWDDAYGRDAKLSVYAVAVPNKTDVQNNSTTLYNLVQKGSTDAVANWQSDAETDALNSIAWQVSNAQTVGFTGTIATEDLCYSHNIQETKDASGSLQYGKGKDGVRIWGKYDTSDQDEKGYPKYKWDGSTTVTDHYPTLDDGQMQFRLTQTGGASDGPGHFDKGHMIFHHALTRITVNLKKSTSDGFKADGTDFVLTDDNITLLNMHFKGTLNIKNGTWSAYTEGNHADNTNVKMATTDKATDVDYTSIAQVVPGFELGKTSTANVMKFTISDNTYYITQKLLFDALNIDANTTRTDINGNKLVTVKNDKITLEQGKNYVFTITIKKTGIAAVTASLVPWVDVNGALEAHNDYVQISLKDKTSEACEYFDLYRMNDDQSSIYAPTTGPGTGTDWSQNYNWLGTAGTDASQNYKDKATKTTTSTTGVWKTNWFWESNKSFYHFRTVNEGLAIQENTTTTADYFNIYGGPIKDYSSTDKTISTAVDDNNVNDFHWGAPFKPAANLVYNVDYGWSAADNANGQIYPAIGSTSGTINIIEHHMMSNVHIILKTKKDDAQTNKLGAGSVDLTDATVKLTNFSNTGTVEMGRGIVKAGETLTSEKQLPTPSPQYKTSGDNTETNKYSYRVVPQILYRGTEATPANDATLTNFIGLTILTKDNNQYYVIKDLSTITATSVKQNGTDYTGGNQSKDEAIKRWYPGYDYTYTITISKKGIETITCSVVDWVKVEAANKDITLED